MCRREVVYLKINIFFLLYSKEWPSICCQPKTSDKARKIFQSSRAKPGGVTATKVCWARPSALTNVACFSVYAAPGRITSAIAAPASP